MNLISEPWIPVRRANGQQDVIAPCHITDHIGTENSPILAIASPRPDFDGALVQFLIGLLQTTCTPATEREWLKWRKAPPSPAILQACFDSVRFAFELEGEYAFMQDFTPSDLTKERPIAALLIESPGEESLDKNADFFIKRGKITHLCPACSAMALLTMQINAPSGGRGYRTSLRGGGPLTTLVLGETLWQTCWNNVLQKSLFIGDTEPEKNKEGDRYPWLTTTRTSEEKPPAGTPAGVVTTPADVHPSHIFWAMPRRIRLVFETFNQNKSCSICSKTSTRVCLNFTTRTYGYNYKCFEHTLSPHYSKDNGVSKDNGSQSMDQSICLQPVHPRSDGIGYRDWLGFIESSKQEGDMRVPAKVVQQYNKSVNEDGRLWAFGYDMDNMKARCWYDAIMPIVIAPKGSEDIFQAWIEKIISSAREASKYTSIAIKDAKGSLSYVSTCFWKDTELAFYQHMRKLRDVLSQSFEGHTECLDEEYPEYPVLESWLKTLRDSALNLFDQYTRVGDFDAVDPSKIANARNYLRIGLCSKKMRGIVGLPILERSDSVS